jgi:ATP-dependent Zn protease
MILASPTVVANRRGLRRKLKTALHEAAHAVACFFRRESGKTALVTMDPNETEPDDLGFHRRGRTVGPITRGCVDWPALRARCVVLLAGIEADLHGVPEAERTTWLTGSGSDLEKAFDLVADALRGELQSDMKAEAAAGVSPDAVEDVTRRLGDAHLARVGPLMLELWGEARALIDEKWEHVEAVAAVLLERETLYGDDVREIIEGVEERLK